MMAQGSGVVIKCNRCRGLVQNQQNIPHDLGSNPHPPGALLIIAIPVAEPSEAFAQYALCQQCPVGWILQDVIFWHLR